MKTKIAFFDAKDYDISSFEAALPAFRETHPEMPEAELKFFDTRLSMDTVNLAKGSDVVCVFVNDIVDAAMAETLKNLGVKIGKGFMDGRDLCYGKLPGRNDPTGSTVSDKTGSLG